MNNLTVYNYEYSDNYGVEKLGMTLHYSDKEAVDYYKSLENNGKIKMIKLKNQLGESIWNLNRK